MRNADLQAGGQVATLIGEGLFKFGDVDGKYPEARLQHCIGVAWHDGFVYVADTYNHKIRRLDPRTKELTAFIGTGQPGMTDGERTAARLNEPNGLCFAKDTMYITDSNNHLIRSCDLKTGRVSTVAFRGLEKLNRKTALPFAGDEIHLDPARISPRAKSLQLGIVLPAGTKLNLAGPSKLSARSANAQIMELGKFETALKGLKVSLPIQAAPGQTTLTLDADLYYCSKANEGLCFFKSARLTLPIEVAADGSAAPTVEYKIERGSK